MRDDVFQRFGNARYDHAEYDRAAFIRSWRSMNGMSSFCGIRTRRPDLVCRLYPESRSRAEGPHLRLTLAATDWGILFERALITQSWPDGTPDSTIIADAIAQVPDLSAGTIVTLVANLGLIEAKDQRVRDLLDDICQLTGGEWNVFPMTAS